LQERGVELRSLTEGIDTSTINGKFTFHLFAALAEFERALIRERTQAGLAAARARGRKGGRPKLLDPEKRRHVVALYNDKQHSRIAAEARTVSPKTGAAPEAVAMEAAAEPLLSES
jgi:DNA invertase Pin-like site-specific DNA recombinase